MNIITTTSISKSFAKQVAKSPDGGFATKLKELFAPPTIKTRVLNDIDLQVEAGEFIGLLGSNGSGKSTLLKLLTGILIPDSGTIEILGLNPVTDRKKYTANIGVVFGQKSLLWWNVPIIESFKLYASIYRLSAKERDSRIEELSALLGLGEILFSPPRKLSLGQRMKAEIAASLLHKPSLIFLDEPTIALDPVSRINLMNFLYDLNQNEGTTILFTSHNMADVHNYCKRCIILNDGSVIYDGKTEELIAFENYKTLELKTESDFDIALLSEFEYEQIDSNWYKIKASYNEIHKAFASLAFNKAVTDLNISPPTLDSAVSHFMKKSEAYKNAS